MAGHIFQLLFYCQPYFVDCLFPSFERTDVSLHLYWVFDDVVALDPADILRRTGPLAGHHRDLVCRARLVDDRRHPDFVHPAVPEVIFKIDGTSFLRQDIGHRLDGTLYRRTPA